jgi:hypothetical protein
MRLVNEGTAVELSAALRGDDGSLITPTTIKYRLDCETTGQAITAWTTLTPEAITSIPILATANAIIDDTNGYEDRVCTVMTDAGLATQQVQVQKYRIENLGGIP